MGGFSLSQSEAAGGCRTAACGADDSQAAANTAHSCRVGFLYLQAATLECSRISNAIAHHTTEVGVVYDREGLSMEVEHVLLSDNRVGLAVMPGAKRAIASGFVSITRSAAIGYSNNGGVPLLEPTRPRQTHGPDLYQC